MQLSFAEIALAVGMTTNMQADVDTGELLCLAKNIYFEARSEPVKGQVAVAHQTLNRVASKRFPDSICAVVQEDRGPKSYDCQYSWWCDGKSDIMQEPKARELAMKIALDAMTGKTKNPVPGATHYFAFNTVTPSWSQKLKLISDIGNHRFMRE